MYNLNKFRIWTTVSVHVKNKTFGISKTQHAILLIMCEFAL